MAIVWAIYWQEDIGHTAHISAVYGQYVTPKPKPNIGHTVSPCHVHIHAIFFFSKCGPHITIMWENYGPYEAEAPEPHMAHMRLRGRSHIWPIHCPQIFFYAGNTVFLHTNYENFNDELYLKMHWKIRENARIRLVLFERTRMTPVFATIAFVLYWKLAKLAIFVVIPRGFSEKSR